MTQPSIIAAGPKILYSEELENPYVFDSPEVVKAGGLEALKALGAPEDIINEAKRSLFAA